MPLPSGAATESTLSSFKTANHTDLGTINTTLGTPFQAGGSIGNTTFACTQSGTFTVQPGNTANTTAWKVDGSAVTQPVSGHVIIDSGSTTVVTGTVTANATLSAETTKVIGTVNQGTSPWVISGALTDTQLRASAVPVSLSTLPALVAGSAVIGHVINDSGSTTAVTGNVASTVADGANVVLGSKDDAKSASTDTTAITIMSVLKEISAMEQAPASRAVTNAGTFATQSTLAAETTKVIGTVNVASAQTIAVTNAGTFATQSTLAAETTKVIGTVNISTGQTVTGLSDGTNTAKVQAASTAAVAADKALTVVQSPNGLNPCMNPGSTLLSITGATSGTSNVQIIGLSGTTKIYICALTVIGVSGTTPTFSLVSGTGSNCASTAATVLQAWTTTAGQLYAFANPVAVVAAGSALCYKGTGTTPVQNYALTYVQQ